MHERLFANQQELEPFRAHAEALALNMEDFEACMESGKYVEIIRQNITQAQKVGISGTPSFILAHTDSGNPEQAKGITMISGAQPFSAFKNVIDKYLEEAKKP